jgi:hypothetical protein
LVFSSAAFLAALSFSKAAFSSLALASRLAFLPLG